MALVYAVMAGSKSEAARALRDLCERMSLEDLGPPMETLTGEKWMGRARARGEDDSPADPQA